MLTEESYKLFFQKIVDTHLEEETEIFDEVGDEAIKAAFESKGFNHQAEVTQNLGAADFAAAGLIIGIVPAILGCYKLILEITKLRKELKPIDEDELKEKWQKQLIGYKIKKDKAKLIADEFTKEMIDLTK